MNKVLIPTHINQMPYTKEFFLLQQPKEMKILFFSVIICFLAVVCIVCFGKIDDVVHVSGIVRTQGNVSSVKNVVPGQIIELKYKPGQKVNKNDVLYKIDPKIYEAQKEMLSSQKEDIKKKLRGLNLLIRSFNEGKNVISKNDSLYYSRFDAFENQKKELLQKEKLSKFLYEEEENNPIAIRNKKNINQRKIEYQVAVSELDSYISDFVAKIHMEKNEVTLEYNKIEAELQKLESEYLFLSVTSPVDGFVQENSSLNVGDYLESNVSVLNIIPNDQRHFRVELQVPPKDIGKIHEGLKVKYRLSAFPYFEYKGAEGTIVSVDPDIRTGLDKSSLFYVIYADIDRTEFCNRKGEKFPIKAGLETDARIVLDRNRIIYYLLKKMDFMV